MNTVLVTGGAGYIGSHTVQQLVARGDRVVVIDNLSTGFREAVRGAAFVEGNVGDCDLVSRTLETYQVDAVLHFAAHTVVPESMSDPLKYYGNNTCNTRNLLACCAQAGVDKFIFSSTAAVYGTTDAGVADENTQTRPINPYGTSKLMSETMLRDWSATGAVRHVILRYFNVAGCDPLGRIGHSTPEATLLIKVACEHAVGKRRSVSIYGTDYDTPDGTGVRDYIHVEDLAAAHLRALDHLRDGGASLTLNCGYGHGYSVREVVDAVARVGGHALNVIELPRRPGDIPKLIACSDRLRQELGWTPRYDDLDFIVRTALTWEYHLAGANLPTASVA
ncbi:UDP-glucose 4-epimerase GalE [Luteibacter rhizovicinus DSM 16549]|uniref:UDP-glucose 4-epimerase n=1 Tax=Luteibacter rhizovicinus DSM 16549 TaxID=1440763 RepID=A0A0G9HFT3_9GAMM|nr:UDP-glucose 4-epimerase GalE [Luteibacter rhizovicinus]APG05419.1 UDP-glucose 4-epimerase GalE [Luteibacter rhizovicinus DSM 16549]KLD68039.1 UDP-glucose 4-epimerase [Luteibacter rhizovicinus DSM 16549]KLD77267.1 UDP-glucose 4-epimerase [Xanthomonas hyacinthi DSM 19077]